MNPRSLKLRLMYILSALICLGIFNLSQLPSRKAEKQSAYEIWLGELEPKLENPALTGTPLPALRVTFDAPIQRLHFSLALAPAADKDTSQRFTRILQMAREANLFSLPSKSGSEISFSIESEKDHFISQFNSRDIEKNAQAQAMLKLLQIYSQSTLASSSSSAPAGEAQ